MSTPSLCNNFQRFNECPSSPNFPYLGSVFRKRAQTHQPKLMRRIFYLILASLTLMGCEDDDDGPASIIGTWRLTEYYSIDPYGNRSPNNQDECSKDDLYQFTDDNVYSLSEGRNVCYPSRETKSTYELSADGKTVKIKNRTSWQIESLTKSTLTVSIQIQFGSSGPSSVEWIYKRQ